MSYSQLPNQPSNAASLHDYLQATVQKKTGRRGALHQKKSDKFKFQINTKNGPESCDREQFYKKLTDLFDATEKITPEIIQGVLKQLSLSKNIIGKRAVEKKMALLRLFHNKLKASKTQIDALSDTEKELCTKIKDTSTFTELQEQEQEQTKEAIDMGELVQLDKQYIISMQSVMGQIEERQTELNSDSAGSAESKQ